MGGKEMKARKLTLISLTILTLLMGATAFAIISATTPIIAEQVKITPKPFDMLNPDGVTVRVKLSLDDIPIVDQIDPETVFLEGFIAPYETWVTDFPIKAFYAKFKTVGSN